MLEGRNVSYRYSGKEKVNKNALNHLNFQIREGEFIGILGANGSGKSTLAAHFNGIRLPLEGVVSVDGMDTASEEDLFEIRRDVGLIMQNPDNQIVQSIVEEDVGFGPENLGIPTLDIWKRVKKGLDQVRMIKHRKKNPMELSGGQKQRVAIAGVLAMEPKYIVFDEATAMLDSKGRRDVLDIARRLQKEQNIAIIWITHDLEEVWEADRILVLNEGELFFQGSPQTLFQEKGELLETCHLKIPEPLRFLQKLIEEQILSPQDLETITMDPKEVAQMLADKIKADPREVGV